jgi:MSHA pilin protein MshC
MERVKKNSGYTVLELITIIILIGVLSIVVVSRFDLNPFQVVGFEQELRSAIRFAQKFAIVSGCEVQVTVNAGGYGMRVRDDADTDGCLAAGDGFGTLLNNPSGGTFTGTPPSGVAITSGLIFIYDRQGRPSVSGTIVAGGQNIVIEAGSGYVH